MMSSKGQILGGGGGGGGNWIRFLPWIIAILLLGLFITIGIGIFGQTGKDFAIPSNFRHGQITAGWIRTLLTTLGLREDWLYVPVLIYFVLIPILGVTTLVYGVLNGMRLFTSGIHFTLALLAGLSIVPLGFLVRVVATVFVFMGASSTIVIGGLFGFGLVFIIMQALYGWGFTTAGTYRGLSMDHRYRQLTSWLQDASARNAGAAGALGATIGTIPTILQNAERGWNAGRHDKVVSDLEGIVRGMYSRIRSQGGNAPKLP